ncbi:MULTISPECIES: bifunctional diaminohydroxyphosphoribosylaminopyrimidine deaminase/5-amino-6-(5-phosphoribosylamino)uracil reductase RibD [Limnochorda]|uniref:bifunctional diaminohydroxyphosphoribosylaminopyrimidine deaminase/5-amino-6-(5-phosphoribosylamino)uracil reductase RibD n=1 Tax=Limnochorda TaxID=1676651 RepID=UPI0026ED8248|nr:bifunctional diaminohydroxyphosphoribosylaminopyrimidine deaminase/5-amino-6-(5-phosphoribosylamino)uracil reductase RibD [Limnochorda pilosa]
METREAAPDPFSADDHRWMGQALALARQGIGHSQPNPAVGAVVVRDGQVVGQGFHRRAGEPHAEVLALREAGEGARGATLYVTLEPCSHQGRTPPCTEAILAAGIQRVVVAARDPNPRVAGGGIERLRQAGITVDVGLRAAESEAINPWFPTYIHLGRPWVHLKLASTLDGRLAARTGDARWITSPAARQEVHWLRHSSGAVMVGAGTVRIDDPALTVRDVEPPGGIHQPWRVVVSRRLQLPLHAQLVTSAGAIPTVVATGPDASPATERELLARGVQVWRLPPDPASPGTGLDLQALLRRLGEAEIASVLVEGGSRLAAALLEQGLVDWVSWYVAPRILGDPGGVPAVAGHPKDRLAEGWRLEPGRVRRVGSDVVFEGVPVRAAEASPAAS